ncbi:IS21 family transposase [Nonomuraea sp. K274]|uniref:IS21 family transposase n=1 Tax=Nonomuraea cypriaca TaxID=1187855 RepID=A0A931AM61_9ACTN|nr:IS21 family transposase [Nonomuraea cypriaca]MBF8194563.1 IS21 family transposase [Nonomuraea cypriaca]
MITVDDWAEIRRLHRAEKMPIKAIARMLGISKNTVRRAVRAIEVPKYERAATGSIVDAVEPQIRAQLELDARMPATTIAERIGWSNSITVLRERVRELRPAYLPVDPASRTVYEPGELAQCDLWFPPITLPGLVEVPPVLVMVSGYSRWTLARMIPSRHAEDLVLATWALLEQLGAVPRALVWDNEGGVGKYRSGRAPLLSGQYNALRGLLATKVIVLPPREPESKGVVERANQYFETSFLPGRVFTGPADFNAQLAAWLTVIASRRKRRLQCAPADRIAADRAAMLELPPIQSGQLGWHNQIRLPRDHWVRLDTCDYSVDPRVIGQRVAVHADLERVSVYCQGRRVASHERCWAAHQTITDPAHAELARQLRAQATAAKLTARSAAAPGTGAAKAEVEVEERSLAVYDGLTSQGAS